MNLVLVWAIACSSAAIALGQVPDCSVARGYTASGAARTFTTDTLYEYMDGNSEGYFAYGFVTMHGVTCKSGENTLLIDISEMADSELAYGMFCSTRDPARPTEALGAAGQIQPRKAIFVKGKYYVEVGAEPDKDHTATLLAVAAELEKRTPGETSRPAALEWFPTAGLEAGSPRLIPQSVLGLRILKRGYVAQYEGAKAFVVLEESAESAAAVFGRLRERFAGEAKRAAVGDEGHAASDRYLGRLCVFRKGRFVAGLVNVADGRSPEGLAAGLAARIP